MNTGAVTLYKQSIIDDVISNSAGNTNCGASLAPGASCVTTPYTIQGDDPDPLVNTVSVLYNRLNSNLLGAQVTDSASHSWPVPARRHDHEDR